MTAPIEINIPHQLGKQGVRDRLDGGIGKIGRLIPGGAQVDHVIALDAVELYRPLRAVRHRSHQRRCLTGARAGGSIVIGFPGLF